MPPQPAPQPAPRPGPPAAEQPHSSPPRVAFDVLAAGAREVLIEHDGQVYRLRVTRNQKLILNK